MTVSFGSSVSPHLVHIGELALDLGIRAIRALTCFATATLVRASGQAGTYAASLGDRVAADQELVARWGVGNTEDGEQIADMPSRPGAGGLRRSPSALPGTGSASSSNSRCHGAGLAYSVSHPHLTERNGPPPTSLVGGGPLAPAAQLILATAERSDFLYASTIAWSIGPWPPS
ncbi:hypothetical protein GCM10009557_02210 [Virgisporangium ochraceum]|uniref:Uncharacterized protein n=1 Tax=Virgisporangium ochraceum TaxID=65505 RepID=A0A8J3ZZ56_9ACTN|nr:hypothetical protein Voc01_077710 [Virgisporangium ochraceum]